MTPERMHALLERMEWAVNDEVEGPCCPCCNRSCPDHAPSCELAAALAVSVATDLTPAPAEVAADSCSGDEGQGLVSQWREWYRQSGGEYWDKVVDIERELGRGPDAPAAPWCPPSAMTLADIVAALALIHHDGSDAPATRLGFYGAEPVEPDLCALLKRLEWVVDYERVEPCPLCHETITTPRGELPAESKGHAPDCELAAVLAEQTAPHHSRVLAGGEAVTEYRTTEPDGTRHTLCLIDVPPPSLNQRVTVIIHGDSPTTVEFVAVGVTTKRRIAYGVEYQGQDSVVELRQVKREALP